MMLIALSSDGLDKTDFSDAGNGLKNQVVGFLQAVSYLKGISIPFVINSLLTSSIHWFIVPLIAVNVLVIAIEIIAG